MSTGWQPGFVEDTEGLLSRLPESGGSPSWELCKAQSPECRKSALPKSVGARLAVEAGVTPGWHKHKYVGDQGDVIWWTVWAFGPVVMRDYRLTAAHTRHRAAALPARCSI